MHLFHSNQRTPLASSLRLALILTALILVAELLGGYFANSLALLSDAGHVFTDALALVLSWFGVSQAARPATARMTYGYHRTGILIAAINALTLIAISAAIFYEAYRRLQHPEPVAGLLMFGVALVGLVVNLAVVLMLRRHQGTSLNVRSAFLHAASDALGSVGVIVGGIVIYFTGLFWVDPAISILIGIIILFYCWRIIREAVAIFMEAAPAHLNVEDMAKALGQLPGVRGVHDLHVWSIASGIHSLSCHLVVEDLPVSQGSALQEQVKEMLARRFGIGHTTIQLECQPCCDPAALYCSLNAEGEPEASRRGSEALRGRRHPQNGAPK